jgi:hypothetical protein
MHYLIILLVVIIRAPATILSILIALVTTLDLLFRKKIIKYYQIQLTQLTCLVSLKIN